jgi:hypothetical protein
MYVCPQAILSYLNFIPQQFNLTETPSSTQTPVNTIPPAPTPTTTAVESFFCLLNHLKQY